MTIARADETYLIKDTYKDYTVSGSIVYPTDDNKRISVSLSIPIFSLVSSIVL